MSPRGRPTLYDWPRLAEKGSVEDRPSAFYGAPRLKDQEEARKVYLRIYASGSRWCARNRPELKPVIRRTIGGFRYWLTPKHEDSTDE